MMLKTKYKFKPEELVCSEKFVETAVAESSMFFTGGVEAHRQEINTLAEIVSCIYNTLPEHLQVQVAENFGYEEA